MKISLIQNQVDQHIRAGEFIAAAETVDQNIDRGSMLDASTMARKELMSIVAISAFQAGDTVATREIFGRFAIDLSSTAMEVVQQDEELVRQLQADVDFDPAEFDDEPTCEWTPSRKLLATVRNG